MLSDHIVQDFAQSLVLGYTSIFLLYLSFFVIPILLIPNFLRYNKNWYNKSFTKYNQKWYNKYFQEISGITNWDINENISCVVKYPKSFSMGGQRYCNFCVRNIENQNHSLGPDEEMFIVVVGTYGKIRVRLGMVR